MPDTLNLVKKITPAMLGFDKKDILKLVVDKEIGDRVFLYSLAGVVNRVEYGEGQYGTYAKFIGDFAAKIPGQDDLVRSPNCFLQGVFSDVLEAAIMGNVSPVVEEDDDNEGRENVKKKGGKGKVRNVGAIDFSVNIFVEKIERGVGYSYHVEPTVQPQPNNHVTKLLESSLKAVEENPEGKKVTRKTSKK